MGVSTSACPTRKHSPDSAGVPNAKHEKFADELEPKYDKNPQSDRIVTLPTQSWRVLLQDTTLNPEAEPFHPKEVPYPSVVTAKNNIGMSAPPGLTTSLDSSENAEDEPWMQYLEKRFHANNTAGPSHTQSKLPPWNPADEPPSNSRSKPSLSLRPPRTPLQNLRTDNLPLSAKVKAGDGNTNAGLGAIQTQTYLQLLKEGGTTAPKRIKNSYGKAAYEKKRDAEITTQNSTPLRAEKVVTQLRCQSLFQSWQNLPITTSSLANMLSFRDLKEVSGLQYTTEDVLQPKCIRDDISAEKLFVDEDVSDLAYWSETESVDIKKASTHRLGRRPRAARAEIRSYVMQDLNYLLDRSVGMLLHRLQYYTEQQKTIFTSPDSSNPRRFVIGLKEVVRRIKQCKVECLIVAPDIQEDVNTGGLDDRMREMLALTYQGKIPVMFALSRARLGKALGKSLNISVLGVLDATGARELFNESVKLANDSRQAWLARLGK